MIYKNAKENVNCSIDCLIYLSQEWVSHCQDPTMEYYLSDELGADDWADIKPCPQSEKDAHQAKQAKAEIIKQLADLDLPAHTLALAISSDELALKKVADNEALKAPLREELAAIK